MRSKVPEIPEWVYFVITLLGVALAIALPFFLMLPPWTLIISIFIIFPGVTGSFILLFSYLDRRRIERLASAGEIAKLITALCNGSLETQEKTVAVLGRLPEAIEPLLRIECDPTEPRLTRTLARKALDQFRQPEHMSIIEQTRRAAEEREHPMRITHLLILIDKKPLPPAREEVFLDNLLDNLYFEGKPYRNYVDSETKIVFKVVGKQRIDEEANSPPYLVASLCSTWSPEVVPRSGERIKFQRFSGLGAKGTTVEIWG